MHFQSVRFWLAKKEKGKLNISSHTSVLASSQLFKGLGVSFRNASILIYKTLHFHLYKQETGRLEKTICVFLPLLKLLENLLSKHFSVNNRPKDALQTKMFNCVWLIHVFFHQSRDALQCINDRTTWQYPCTINEHSRQHVHATEWDTPIQLPGSKAWCRSCLPLPLLPQGASCIMRIVLGKRTPLTAKEQRCS